MTILVDAGWVTKRDDPLRQRRATYELREPLVRFHRLVIEPSEQRLLAGAPPERVWLGAQPSVASLVLPRQLESIAIDWALRYASPDTFDGFVTSAGSTEIGRYQVDLAMVETTPRGSRRLLAVGEVKATSAKVGVGVLDRLDAICATTEAQPARRRD